MNRLVGFALLLAMATPAPPQAGAPLDERVTALVKSEILDKGVPGVSAAVMRDGKMILERGWGFSDVEKKTRADASTTSQIASVTKPFTAVLVLKLVDRGRLSLGDTLGKHLPGLSPAFDTFTIEQMLNHTSGLANDYRDPQRRLENRTTAELVAMAAATPLANKPGTTYVYSNTGYMLLAAVVEKLYGKSYAAAVRDEFVVPLGLTSLAQCAEPRPGEAIGSRRMPDGKLVPAPGIHHSQLLGAGGICASAGDLVKWMHALNTGRLLSPGSYAAMTTPRGAAVSSNYGLGLWVRPAPWGAKAIVAGGQTQNGHTAELQWYPEQSLAMALLYNVAPRLPNVADLIPKIVLGVPLAEQKPQEVPLEDHVGAIVKSEILAVGVPSASVAVLRDGKMVLERAWGTADVDKNISATSTTTYPIGSITKQFTAALLLKQVDRGRLAVTDTIGKHFPDLPAEISPITIEQLLNHTSGLKRAIADEETPFEVMTTASLVAKAVRDKVEAKPGTTFSYSNAGYTILGALVEKLYEKSYAASLRDEIAVPLELHTLRKCDEPQAGDGRGYIRAQTGKPGQPPGLHHSQELGAGGICATAADLVKWTHALHTGRVLSPASYQAMTTPRGAATRSNYGFGLSVTLSAWDQKAIIHGGQSLTGHTAELNWYPDQSVAVALLYNAYPRVPGVSDLVPRLALGIPLPATGATSAPAAAAPVERSKLTGIYELGTNRTFEVTLESGELYVTPPGGSSRQPLLFRSGNSYALGKADSTTVITFFVENGVATAFEANDNGIKRVLKKIR